QGTGREGARGLLTVAIALLVAMPLLALGSPANFLPILTGADQYGYYAVAGLLLFAARRFGVRRLAEGPSWLPDNLRATAGVAGLALVSVYVLLLPISAIFHRLVPTPERMVIWAVGTLLMAPLFLASESLIRKGSLRSAIGLGAASRVMSLLVLAIGIRLGFLPGVLSLIMPILLLIFVMVEIFAAGVYWRSRNVWLIALVEAAWIAWLAAIAGPVI
ncbi:MAG TPA: hypothetical protein VFB78_06420, partial [Acidimicrobiales bacterium]|nr:hypothetical protein [Acidimicrobiales bacterium]